MKKIVSVLLVVAMIFSMTATAFAMEHGENSEPQTFGLIGSPAFEGMQEDSAQLTAEDIRIAKNAYDALSPRAKAIFEASMLSDPEMMAFHQAYVDASFSVRRAVSASQGLGTATIMATDPMTILNTNLAALSLPSAVLYSLKAMGAGLVAAIADGPLPFGDILLAAATAGAVVVIALNWNEVCSKWSGIVNAFKAAFAASASVVVNAFNSLRNSIQSEVAANPCVSVSGRTITINGTKYYCNTKVDALSASQKQGKKYYPAVLAGGTVLIAPVNLPTNLAKAVLSLNSSTVGIMTTTASYARGICGNNPRWDNVHKSNEGYFFHYHPSYAVNAHCWYLF